MSKILVSGSLAYDRIMDFDGLFAEHFLPEKLHAINLSFQVRTVAENFGGCSGNIAYNLRLLGEEPRIIAVAGNDFARYAEYLRSFGIDTSSIRIDGRSPTSAAFIMTDKADNQIAAFSMGAGEIAYQPLPDTKGAAHAIVSAGNTDDVRALPAHYRGAKVPYCYDPGQAIPALSAEDLRDGIEGAAALFGNDYEIELVMRKTGWGIEELAARTSFVVTTLGEHGSRVRSGKDEIEVPAVSVQNAVDPTGAGDAYRAGFLKGIVMGLSLAQCARLGSAVASYAVEVHGTQNHHFTLPELAARYQRTYGETLSL
jgi:adenosine kinase